MHEVVGRDELIEKLPESTVLSAFAAIAARRGIDTTVEQLRRSYAYSLGEQEPATETIISIARDLGLEAQKLVTTWADLPRLRRSLPAMLRLRDGSALILVDIHTDTPSGTIAVVRDPLTPADATVAVDEARLDAVWDGEVILVKRRYALTDEQRPFGLSWLLGQVLRERALFTDIAVAATVNTIFAIAPPLIFMVVINRVLVNRSFSTLHVIAAAVLIMIVFEMILSYLRRVLMEITTTRIDARLNLYLFEKLVGLPLEYFERNPTGRIMSKLGRVWQVRHFMTGQLFGVFVDAVPLLGLVPVMIWLDWRLALIVFALTGVIFLIVLGFIRPLGALYHKVVIAEQAKGAHLVESIYGMRTIKSLAIEGRRRQEWDRHVAEATAARHGLGIMSNYPETMSLPFERLIYSGSFLAGAYIILAYPTAMNPGVLIAFAMLAMRMAQPLIQFARLLQDAAEARGAIDELATIMNEPAEQGHIGTGLRLPIHGGISFKDVRFRYSSGAPYALNSVTFDVERGTIFGIMGRSGSGKSTITRLLQGLNTGYEGVIKIDGMDLREVDLNHLRTSIGVVAAETFLFSGSVRDNIAISKPGVSFAEIVRAAQLAGAEEFIEQMPRGYDTFLEEAAVNLSSGQRQRLAIARALLTDPAVLILDEATSALDAESEAIINANLQRIASGRTIICVSHRLSMIVAADAILVMDRGRVADLGRHEELLHRCDIYKQLWYQQNRHITRGSGNAVLQLRATEA